MGGGVGNKVGKGDLQIEGWETPLIVEKQELHHISSQKPGKQEEKCWEGVENKPKYNSVPYENTLQKWLRNIDFLNGPKIEEICC